MKRDNHRLQLEFLESRVMLAGGDDASRVVALAAVETAVFDEGNVIDVDLMETERVLKITGSGEGSVTIDLSELPASVVNLQISSFNSVTLIGEHKVDSLLLSDIAKVDAGGISIGQILWANDVQHIKIDTAPQWVWLQGPRILNEVTIGDKTLLEASRFSTAPGAYIFAWVENLGLATNSHVESIPDITSLDGTSVLLNFEPVQSIKTNAHEVAMVTGGDFNRYFFASQSERTALDRSQVITRDLAVTHVSLSTLLNNPAIRAALAEFSENNAVGAAPPIRLLDAEFSSERPGATTLHVDFQDFTTEAFDADSRMREQQAVLFPIETMRPGAAIAADTAGDANPTPEFESRMALDGAQMRFQSIDESAEAGPRNANTPQDAFDRMITSIRAQLTTFGEMMTEELNEHLRTDRQMALLADTRLSRTRAVQDFLVINV